MKHFLFIAIVLTSLQAHTQLSMTIQVPPTGVLLKNQLWNALIVNNAVGSRQLKLSLVLSDLDAHLPVLSATTMPFLISAGAKQLRASDVSVLYNYEPASTMDRDPNGFLSAGNYEACYTLLDVTNVHEVETLEDCIDFTVEPLMPPMLNMPANQGVLKSITQFSWLPPSPINIFNNLTYNIIVTEVQAGQTAAEAIQQNIPVINNNNQNLFLTPSLNPVLDTGKVYAWQVIAKNKNFYSAQSEVWTFKLITSNADSIQQKSQSFIELKNTQEASGINILKDKTLQLKYYSFDPAHTVTITFYDPESKIVKQLKEKIVYGDNLLRLILDNSFKVKKTYLVEIQLNNTQKLTTSFILQ